MAVTMQPMRLPSGGLIDRSSSLDFSFDGKHYQGFAGDTLASALLANGVHLVGRSFKYHRPRGILSAGPEESNALVELRDGARREPNTRATVAELYQGLTAASQNRWPSLAFDIQAINGLAGPILAAGFYYKTFMWPQALWEKLYEPLIRRAAGLGRASRLADPDTYEKTTEHCDLLVIGAGPTGLMAALAAARSGARVIVACEDFVLGGSCLFDQRSIGEESSLTWGQAIEAELASLPDVTILRRTSVFGVYDGGTYGAVERVSDHLAVPSGGQPRQRLIRIVAKRAILAAGAIERPLVFGGNDRPGIMLAGAVRTYLNRFAVKPGERAVVFANNDDAARTVMDLAEHGVAVAALVDPRPSIDPALQAAIEAAGARVLTNAVITGAKGGRRVTQVEVMGGDGARLTLDCDLLTMSGGWSPSIHLTCHLGGRGRWDADLGAFLPGSLPPGMTVIGAANGRFGLDQGLREAAEAGVAAVSDCGFEAQLPTIPEVEKTPDGSSPLWRVAKPLSKAFVDFQNDVTHRDIELAAREGFRSVEHVKRYTTLGMATDGGKTSSVNAIGIMAEISGKEMGEVGTTTYRPPYTPLSLGALAGHGKGKDFRPTRLTPSHRWAEERGAVFVESGAWLRAQYFPKPGEMDWLTTVNREVLGVRSAVGVCDVSTLGKIDVQGADAVQFLDRLYINGWKSLAVGRARYGVMLREDGFVLDDGTTARLGDDRFFMTTTTANAARVYQHMQFCHQCLWPELDVQFTSITDQWAQFAVAGPRSRDVLRVLVDPHHDISNEAFPYLTAAELSICGGVKARLFRISFSGELAYELSVPARFGDAVIRRLIEAGREFGIIPYGTEALGVMRVEKGHLGGSELNGQTTSRDLGLGRMAASNKDYIGRALTTRPALVDPERPIFVGFKPVDPSARLRAGAHFVPEGTKPTASDDQGHMTSVAYSPMLGHWIGLGLLKRGAERIGERVRAYDPVRNGDVVVEICSPAFYDPQGERLRV